MTEVTRDADEAAFAELIEARIFRSTWRFDVTSASGQPAMVGRRRNPDSGRYELGALTVFTFEGELVAAITAFMGPGVLGRFWPGETLRDLGDLSARPMIQVPESALNR